MLIGVPASGKSTFAKILEEDGAFVVSTDALRKDFFGDESKMFDKKVTKEELAKRGEIYERTSRKRYWFRK